MLNIKKNPTGKSNLVMSFTYLFIIMLIGAFFACGRLDFSNPNPDASTADVQSLVVAAESAMRLEWDIYIRDVSIFGREAYYFEPADPRYTGELVRGAIDPGGFLLNRPWGARYRVVKTCNLLIDAASSLPAPDQSATIGFAKTLQAYQLLLNLGLEDDNGIKIDFSGATDVPFVTKAQSFAFINTLLDDANTALAAAGSTFPFKLTSGFAGFDTPVNFVKFNRALKARALVYNDDFTGALTALGSSFVSTSAAMDLGVYFIYSTASNDQLNTIYESPTSSFVKFRAHLSFKTGAEIGDTRYTNKVAAISDSALFDGLQSYLAVSVFKTATDPFPIIRNEELILLRAEANIGLNNLGAAQADIDVVRAAAGLASVGVLPDQATALTKLLYEKQYSLFCEGYRWIDLRHYGKLGTLPLDRSGDAIPAKMPKPETEPNP